MFNGVIYWFEGVEKWLTGLVPVDRWAIVLAILSLAANIVFILYYLRTKGDS